MGKVIKSVRVVEAGSPPDVDSDIATYAREPLVEHLYELYGRDSVSNIITFSTLAAKGAIKAMCTIYKIPFVQANKITNLIPQPIEGVECTVDDIFNPASDRYEEAGEFREAVSDPKWTPIIDGAKAIEGRMKSTGVHACGVVISSRKLSEVIPLQVRQDDGRTISQWTYPDLEAIGLLKMDLLGLETIDIIQLTVNYIIRSGKMPPNMVEIAAGNMDDPKVYEMLRRGETIGIFQLAGDGVSQLLKQMQISEFEDIVASTALYRPGPMGMKSHVRYAERKTGREPVSMPHADFKGTILEGILSKTYGVIVYQETILEIANKIAGMTLQEGDKLRKAMGKKQKDIMLYMKPKFVNGAISNGYSKEAVERLWDTLAEFAKYGFNRAHSVAYGMLAYQCAYLKANYPLEFMSALIAQAVGNKDKILPFIQEAKRMGLKIGSVDINASGIRVAPNLDGNIPVDILYGISGVKAVSESNAKMIIEEREENGPFENVQNFVDRCVKIGIANKTIFENLALAGAFDNFNVSRKAVVDNLPKMLDGAKTSNTRGVSLFDMFSEDVSDSILDLSSGDEYDFVEKLQKEADVIGLYLTGHPLDNLGSGLTLADFQKIGKIFKNNSTVTATIVGAVGEIVKKNRKNGVQIQIAVDDGTGILRANLSRDIVHGMAKKNSQDRLKKLYCDGNLEIRSEIEKNALDTRFYPMDELVPNAVYSMSVTFRPARNDGQYGARVNWIRPLLLTPEGKLPIRIRVPSNGGVAKAKATIKDLNENLNKLPSGDYQVYLCGYKNISHVVDEIANQRPYFDAIQQIKDELVERQKESEKVLAMNKTLPKEKQLPDPMESKIPREWPPPLSDIYYDLDSTPDIFVNERNKIGYSIDSLNYKPLGVSVAKNSKTIQMIEKFVGVENYDYGIFDPSVLS